MKGPILAVLWELFPAHPNLLPAYFTPEYLDASFVAKPFFRAKAQT